LEAVHHWHLHVERDEVWIHLGNFGETDLAVGRCADDFNLRVLSQAIGHQPANDDGIVHNKDSNFSHDDSVQQEQVELVEQHFFGEGFHEIFTGPGAQGLPDVFHVILGG
jgi:hypothetical protein